MSAHISFHGPYKFAAHYVPREVAGRGYVEFKADTSDNSYVAIYLHTQEQADALVRAALAARDLLPGPEPCGDIAPHTKLPCELPPGHEGDHRSGQIVWPWADDPPPLSRDLSGDLDAIPASRIGDPAPLPPYEEPPGIEHCAPGDCTCGGHVTADGVFHPAAVTS